MIYLSLIIVNIPAFAGSGLDFDLKPVAEGIINSIYLRV
jgi:hypothetical protein